MVDVLFRGIENVVVVIHEANDATFSSDVRTTGPEGVRVSAVGRMLMFIASRNVVCCQFESITYSIQNELRRVVLPHYTTRVTSQ